MIINLWSTPRTGSVWYSFHLAKQYNESLLITEMFNRFHMDMYHIRNLDGSIKNTHEYSPGSFYKEYYLDDQKNIRKRNIQQKRIRNIDDEEQYCFDLIKLYNKTQTLILHNHIDPINLTIRDYLIDQAEKNIWIYRKNKKQQLGSYAVALSTKKFAAFKKQPPVSTKVEDCDVESLINLIRRIKIWDSLNKENSNSEIIAFEDIQFYEEKGFPFDQNVNPLLRLSNNMKQIIDDLVTNYENDKN